MAHGKLIGKWFHSFDTEGDIKWQGRVIGKPDGLYLLQLYDWFMGQPSNQTLVAPREIVGWHLYDTAEEMREAWEQSETFINTFARFTPSSSGSANPQNG